MKKWTIILVLVMLLSACGTSQANQKATADQNQNQSSTKTENKTDENINEEGSSNSDTNQQQKDQQKDSEDNTKASVEEPQPKEIKPEYKVTDVWTVKPISDANKKVVLLTIDDAPDKHAVEMAKTLKKLNVPAIFFVNGHFIATKEGQQKLKDIYNMGFTIGNHTYHHQKLDDVSEEKQKEEINSLNDLIVKVIGERPTFFRAPNGVNTEYEKQLVKNEGMQVMNWTYGYDYFKPYMDTEKIKEAMISGKGPEVGVSYSLLKPGAILLMHDRPWTAEALEDIVNGLREKGYDFVDPHLIQTPKGPQG